MKLLDEGHGARFARFSGGLSLALALGACGMVGGGDGADGLALATTGAPNLGPGGDYPVVVGAPYTVAGTAYTPEDVLNYDQVGYLTVDPSGGTDVTAAHHTLPLPSYIEVTSLDTGKTIVVRVERRGPMQSNELVALSPGALEQLGGSANAPVRVRRVNPPEDQRTLLRAGQRAEARIDTPMSLVEILKRKLPGRGVEPVNVAQAPVAAPAPRLTPIPAVAVAASEALASVVPAAARTPAPARAPAPAPAATPAPAPVPTPAMAHGAFTVQAAAFASADNARSAARRLEGDVSQAGRFYRVRTGPFATRGEAEASLAKVRAAGYSDARIVTSG